MSNDSTPEGNLPHPQSDERDTFSRDEIDMYLGSAAAAEFLLGDDYLEKLVIPTDEEVELETQRRKERLRAIDGPGLLERLELGDTEGAEDDISIVLGALSELEHLVIPLLYGLTNDERLRLTPNQIAKSYGIPLKRVKEIQASAVHKISTGDYSY